jgi:hypothetical protein
LYGIKDEAQFVARGLFESTRCDPTTNRSGSAGIFSVSGSVATRGIQNWQVVGEVQE